MPRLTVRAGSAVAVAVAVWAAPSLAEQQIQAATPNRYLTTDVTAAQGETVVFRNGDVASHDVTADATGPDGKPLFSTPIIGRGEQAEVQGTKYLTTGTYTFHCSVHPQMKGTLRISAEGTPVPRPSAGQPAAADHRAPRLGVSIVSRTSRLARSGLRVRLAVDEAASVRVVAQARPKAGGPVVTIARGTVRLPAAGVRRAVVPLTAAGRRALRRPRTLGILVSARAADAAGNATRERAGRNLRP